MTETEPSTVVDGGEPAVLADDPQDGLAADLADLDIVLVHDPVHTLNGGIDVIANIARFLDAPVYTLRQTTSPPALADLDVRVIADRQPAYHRIFERLGWNRLLEYPKMLAYQAWDPPRDPDVLVTTGSRSAHVVHHPEQLRIHFYHTPPRWLWDRTHGQWADRHRLVRWAMLRYADRLRVRDVVATHRFDQVVANSELVARRVEAYYGRSAAVAYCPVDTFDYRHAASEGYFVVVNRLVPAKRVKLAVEAFNKLGLPLKVAGVPDDLHSEYADTCRAVAGGTVEFLDWVDGEEKTELLANCEGLVFLGESEDFGMPPVEAMAAGKPVVGVNEGFTKVQIEEGVNGILTEPTVDGLVAAVRQCREVDWNHEAIQARSRRFDVRAVRETWMDILRHLTEQDPVGGGSDG